MRRSVIGDALNRTSGTDLDIPPPGILALTRGELRIVQTSLLGSILSNLLLVLGCSFLVGGSRFKEQTFQMTAVQASSSLMVLGCSTLVIPAAYRTSQLDGSLDHSSNGSLVGLAEELGKQKGLDGLLKLSRGTAIVRVLSLGEVSLDWRRDSPPIPNRSSSSATLAVRGAAATMSSRNGRLISSVLPTADLFFQLQTHHYLFQDPNEDEEEEAKMNVTTAIGALVVITVVTSFCADYLVGAIDEFAQDFNIPKAFIGLILLPIVGNAAGAFLRLLRLLGRDADLFHLLFRFSALFQNMSRGVSGIRLTGAE